MQEAVDMFMMGGGGIALAATFIKKGRIARDRAPYSAASTAYRARGLEFCRWRWTRAKEENYQGDSHGAGGRPAIGY